MEEQVLESQRIFQGRVLSLRVDLVELADGRRARREIVEHGDSVVMVPVDRHGNVLLVRQYRLAAGGVLLEVPAGGVEEGESVEEAVLRELREETGHTAGQVTPLGGFWMTPGFCTEYMHAFLARDLRPAPGHPDEDEAIQVVPVPLAQVSGLIQRGEIRDVKSIAALLLALHLRPEGQV